VILSPSIGQSSQQDICLGWNPGVIIPKPASNIAIILTNEAGEFALTDANAIETFSPFGRGHGLIRHLSNSFFWFSAPSISLGDPLETPLVSGGAECANLARMSAQESDDGQRRDVLLLRLLKTPPKPRPKRERDKGKVIRSDEKRASARKRAPTA
jgi:hypothetical protein